MSEKRREHRLKANLPIKIISANGTEILGSTGNISRLGTYLEVDKEIPAGENVDVTLELPAYSHDLSLAGEIRCKGNVFRCNLVREFESSKIYGIGVFFTDFDENQDKEKLSQFIDFLTIKEEQEIKDGLKRRREKEEAEKAIKHTDEFYIRQEQYQKETINLLKQIQVRLEDISRKLQADDKKQN